MTRRVVPLIAVALSACTEVSTDPNAVVALRFEGSAYPSIVAGDSLRDSLGALQPLTATALNYKSEPIQGVTFIFSSPDTVLQMLDGGGVFARVRKTDAPARVFASVGSLLSQPDSLFSVPRVDSMANGKAQDTIVVTTSGGVSGVDSVRFFLFGDTLKGAPKMPVQAWLVSFQLRYRGTVIAPTDTSFAYTFEVSGGATPRRIPTLVDTTDAQGKAARRVFVRSLSTTAAEDTIFVIATARLRRAGTQPLTRETRIILRRQ